MSDQPLTKGAVNPVRALASTRTFEMLLDALPQTFHQLVVLVQLEYEERAYLLWLSLLFSALSIGYPSVRRKKLAGIYTTIP